jgi:hypothetical protein
LLIVNLSAIAQTEKTTATTKDTVPTQDLGNVIRKAFKSGAPDTTSSPETGIAVLPTLGYNPSFGFQVGAKLSVQNYLGDPKNTTLSVSGLILAITSKGIINAQLIHNLFTSEDKMNWQGNLQVSRFGITDYGLGPGPGYPDSADLIRYIYIRIDEQALFKVSAHSYLGAGINFNFRTKIDDENQSETYNTANQNYSDEFGFNPEHNNANALVLVYQFTTREHPLRSYGGMYANVYFLLDQTWLGSSKNALRVVYDFRKYWSLSKRNPANVLAIWSLASFTLNGTLPYLGLPNTTQDPYYRSGRGYTIGRFRGPSYFYFETEYRFPITRNKFLSGVGFINTSTTSNVDNKKMFNYWSAAGGVGLRILLQKAQRTTLCIDYGKGEYGSYGIYFGLNEVF